LEAVSSLQNYFIQVQTNLEAETAAYKELAGEVKESQDEIQRLTDIESSRMRHEAPSLDQARTSVVVCDRCCHLCASLANFTPR
jgi:hypothetical protein